MLVGIINIQWRALQWQQTVLSHTLNEAYGGWLVVLLFK